MTFDSAAPGVYGDYERARRVTAGTAGSHVHDLEYSLERGWFCPGCDRPIDEII